MIGKCYCNHISYWDTDEYNNISPKCFHEGVILFYELNTLVKTSY